MPEDQITILLVEDNAVDVEAVRRSFRKHAIDNPRIVARDGVEALELLRADPGKITQPFVILLDLNMPRMNGLQFLDELRKSDELRRSIVFMLTTSEDERDRAAAFDRFVAGYICKQDLGEGLSKLVRLIEALRLTIRFPPKH